MHDWCPYIRVLLEDAKKAWRLILVLATPTARTPEGHRAATVYLMVNEQTANDPHIWPSAVGAF